MTIEKVKVNPDGGLTTVVFTRLGGDGLDTVTVESKDAPRPEFQAALDALRETFRTSMKLDVPDDAVVVRGVSFKDAKRGSEDVDGCVLTATVALPDFKGPATMNTPHAAFMALSDYDGPARLEALREEAKQYVLGKRAQGSLFADAPSGDGQASDAPEIVASTPKRGRKKAAPSEA